MKLPCLIPVVFVFTVGLVDIHATRTARADVSNWPAVAGPRLKDIYELSKFRATSVRAEWSADGNTCSIEKRNPRSGDLQRLQYDAQTRTLQLVREQRNRAVSQSPERPFRLETRGPRLFLVSNESGSRKTLLDFSERDNTWIRQASFSPDGSRVVFIEMNDSQVPERAMLLPTDPSYPKVEYRKFARIGGPIPELRVGVVGITDQEVKWLPIPMDDEGGYLGQVEFAGNSSEILVETLSRFRNQRAFTLFNLEDDSLRTLFQDTNEAWAVGSQEIIKGLTWIRDGAACVVMSEKDGWRHAYVVSRENGAETLITPGDYEIIDQTFVDEAGGWFYFYASPKNGTQKYLHRVPLAGTGKLQRITPADQPGTHDYDFSPDGRYALHTYSTVNSPPVVEIVTLPDHKTEAVIEENDDIRQRMQDLDLPKTEFLQLDIGDGIEMDAWLIRPPNCDPSKKYPIFVYVYGEPYAQTVLDSWGTHHADFHRLVAELGYVVVSIDNRGTPSPKGSAWRRAIYGSLGPLSTEEQAAGLQELARQRPFADISRVAIWGWSGGGSNTLNALFRRPDLYDVGIAVVPKPQPHLYNAWFQEIYMQTPETNPEGYRTSAPINFAEGLEGKLLIITGSGETNTHIQIVEGLVDRLIELGKAFDYMVYPNRDHGLRKGPGTGVHLRMLMIRYLIDNLPRDPR